MVMVSWLKEQIGPGWIVKFETHSGLDFWGRVIEVLPQRSRTSIYVEAAVAELQDCIKGVEERVLELEGIVERGTLREDLEELFHQLARSLEQREGSEWRARQIVAL